MGLTNRVSAASLEGDAECAGNAKPRARDFHHGPETSSVSLDEAEDTNAVRSRHHNCQPALAEGVQIP